ncbi:unnamed protein product [Symbiodinium necroappetens]|uniref:Uncharacterized protein n=1 Tax=Symbiodinium necroappetens TaxID=1628268 RepID=A0A812LAN5_9DINO|nr:unnamed protein product [Symbiodinium necroappetens]
MLRPLALLAWLAGAVALPSSCRQYWEDPQMRAHLLWQSLRCVGQAGAEIKHAEHCMGIVCTWTVIRAETPECATTASCAASCDKAEGCSDFSRFCGAITAQGSTFFLSAAQDQPLANSTALMGTTSANRSVQANPSTHIQKLLLHYTAVKACITVTVILGLALAFTAFWARKSRPEGAEPLLG